MFYFPLQMLILDKSPKRGPQGTVLKGGKTADDMVLLLPLQTRPGPSAMDAACGRTCPVA